MPARLRPTAPIAADAILVGDPGRALMLAQELLEQPKMSNHARGLWGYTGETEVRRELTIQSTGMGGPSATVVLNDLAELGVRRAIRIGTCSSSGTLGLGDLMVVTEARTQADEAVVPDRDLTLSLSRQLGEKGGQGAVVSLDTLHRPGVDVPAAEEVADMQTAALLSAGAARGLAVAAVLVVTHVSGAPDLEGEDLDPRVKELGTAAKAVLST